MNDQREKLAEYAHTAWSAWMKYLFGKSKTTEHGAVEIPAWAVERWQRQMNTPYDQLSEAEKESDRAEADKMLSLVHPSTPPRASGHCMCGCDACKYCEQLLEKT